MGNYFGPADNVDEMLKISRGTLNSRIPRPWHTAAEGQRMKYLPYGNQYQSSFAIFTLYQSKLKHRFSIADSVKIVSKCLDSICPLPFTCICF